jgi:hypothetical protein
MEASPQVSLPLSARREGSFRLMQNVLPGPHRSGRPSFSVSSSSLLLRPAVPLAKSPGEEIMREGGTQEGAGASIPLPEGAEEASAEAAGALAGADPRGIGDESIQIT